MLLQIHHQEGHLVDHIDPAQRVAELQAIEGHDAALPQQQIAQAEAGVAVAEAGLARAEAGAMPEDLAVAEALVGLAQARRDAAYQAWQSALLLRDNPQEVDLKLSAARTQVAVLEGRSLIEHDVSRPADDISQIHGNIYVGKVQNVLPGMEAAFVDIATPKNAVITITSTAPYLPRSTSPIRLPVVGSKISIEGGPFRMAVHA